MCTTAFGMGVDVPNVDVVYIIYNRGDLVHIAGGLHLALALDLVPWH